MRIVCVQQIGHKQRGERRLLVKHADHGVFVDAHDNGVFQGGRGRRANRLSGEAGFPKKGPLFQNRNDGFFALLRDHGQLDLTRLDIEHGSRRIPLGKDHPFVGEPQTCFLAADFSEERLGMKRRGSFASRRPTRLGFYTTPCVGRWEWGINPGTRSMFCLPG